MILQGSMLLTSLLKDANVRQPALGNGQKIKKKKYIFLVSGTFPGKAYRFILLGFECTINPQNLIKFARAIFLMENPFVFRVTLGVKEVLQS